MTYEPPDMPSEGDAPTYFEGKSGDPPSAPSLPSDDKPAFFDDEAVRRHHAGTEPPPNAGAEHRAVHLRKDDVVANRFQVVKLLGFGGMGAVYHVKDRELHGQDRALKVMLPSLLRSDTARERFLSEVSISQKLNHDGIVRVHDLGLDPKRGFRFLTMEYVEGPTLKRLLEEHGGKLPVDEALDITRQLCDALEYAHQYTVHRDLKPQNVMVQPDGRVKILDFGLAKVLPPGQMVRSKNALGTPYYQAPEQSVHLGDVNQRADIYSLGVMLYQMLTGHFPVGATPAPSRREGSVPEALDAVVMRCIQPEPEDRYADAHALRQAVLNCERAVVEAERAREAIARREEQARKEEEAARRRAEQERRDKEEEARRRAAEEQRRREEARQRTAEQRRIAEEARWRAPPQAFTPTLAILTLAAPAVYPFSKAMLVVACCVAAAVAVAFGIRKKNWAHLGWALSFCILPWLSVACVHGVVLPIGRRVASYQPPSGRGGGYTRTSPSARTRQQESKASSRLEPATVITDFWYGVSWSTGHRERVQRGGMNFREWWAANAWGLSESHDYGWHLTVHDPYGNVVTDASKPNGVRPDKHGYDHGKRVLGLQVSRSWDEASSEMPLGTYVATFTLFDNTLGKQCQKSAQVHVDFSDRDYQTFAKNLITQQGIALDRRGKSEVRVYCRDREITLSGEVHSQAEYDLAYRLAHLPEQDGALGIKNVINKLRISAVVP